jgi:hypothetical protein
MVPAWRPLPRKRGGRQAAPASLRARRAFRAGDGEGRMNDAAGGVVHRLRATGRTVPVPDVPGRTALPNPTLAPVRQSPQVEVLYPVRLDSPAEPASPRRTPPGRDNEGQVRDVVRGLPQRLRRRPAGRTRHGADEGSRGALSFNGGSQSHPPPPMQPRQAAARKFFSGDSRRIPLCEWCSWLSTRTSGAGNAGFKSRKRTVFRRIEDP